MIHIPYVWPMFLSAVLLLSVLFLSLRYRGSPSIIHFRILLAASTAWCVFYAFATMSSRLGMRLILSHAMVTATAAVPPSILLFAIEYSRSKGKPLRALLPAFYLPTAVFSFAEWLMMPAFRGNPHLELSGPVPVLITEKGPLYWAFVAFGSAYSLAAIAILIVSASRSPAKLRSALLFSGGIILPLSITVLDSLGFTPVKGIDFSPAAMAVTAMLFMLAIVRNRLLGIMPVARAILFNSIKDLVLVLDSEGQILDFNRAASKAIGPGLDSSPGTLLSDLPASWASILSPAKGGSAEENCAWVGEGTEARCYQVASTSLSDDHGRLLGTMFVLHDISSAKLKEAALKDFAAEVERTNRLLEENARLREDMERMMTHDIRSPLTGVISLPEMMLRDGGLSHDQREMLGMIIASGRQILSMLDRSLDLYRMENGSYKAEWTELDLLESMDQVLASLSGSIQASKCAIAMSIDSRPRSAADTCPLRADKMLLNSLLANLLKNAIEASPPEAIVTISVERSPAPVVSIANSGEIPEGIRERLFQKGATSGKRGGTGLGLHSARLHARTLGATLSLDSSIPGMTTARIEFSQRA